MGIDMDNRYFKYGNYDLLPYTRIEGYDSHAVKGYDDIIIILKKEIAAGKRVIVCDFYPGVDKEEVLSHLSALQPVLLIESESCAMEEEALNRLFQD